MIPSSGIIRVAKQEAEENIQAQPYRMSAVIYRGHKIIGIGNNKPYKTHPKAPTPFKTIHAEFDAILNATWAGFTTNKASIYVHRVRRDGLDGLAKPCKFCQRMLEWAGIREVYWSK